MVDASMNPAQQHALQDVLRWLAGGALIGAGGRAALGAYQATVDSPSFIPKTKKPILLRVPVPAPDPEPDRQLLKAALDLDLGGFLAKNFPVLGDFYQKNLPAFTGPSGDTAQTPGEVPWRSVGMILGTPLAAALGYRAVNAPVQAAVNATHETEVDRAREEYYQALAANIARSRTGAKAAAADRAEQALDELGAAFEKAAASVQGGMPDWTWGGIKRLLFPLSNLDPWGAAATLGLSGVAAGLGARQAYRGARTASLPRLVAAEAARIEGEDEHEPPVRLVLDPAKRVPVPV